MSESLQQPSRPCVSKATLGCLVVGAAKTPTTAILCRRSADSTIFPQLHFERPAAEVWDRLLTTTMLRLRPASRQQESNFPQREMWFWEEPFLITLPPIMIPSARISTIACSRPQPPNCYGQSATTSNQTPTLMCSLTFMLCNTAQLQKNKKSTSNLLSYLEINLSNS